MFSTAGSGFVYTLPSWFVRHRDYLDAIAIGGGAGGNAGGNAGGLSGVVTPAGGWSTPGGSGGSGSSAGQGAGNYTYNGVTYTGGAALSGNGKANGNAPGGGARSAILIQGGKAGTWAGITVQPEFGDTFTVVVGDGGAADSNGGTGGTGRVWLVARQA